MPSPPPSNPLSDSTTEPAQSGSEAVEGPTPAIVSAAAPVVAGPEIKKKELIDRVVAMSDVKKSDAKRVIEATLVVLGQSISDGEILNVQPFGKLKATRRRDLPNGQAFTLKLRRSAAAMARADASAARKESGT